MHAKTRPAQPAAPVSHSARRPGKPHATGRVFFGNQRDASRATPLMLQRRLVAGHSGDSPERQADAVAEIVTQDTPVPRAVQVVGAARAISPLGRQRPQAKREMSRGETPHDEDRVRAQRQDEPVQAKKQEEQIRAQGANEQEMQAKAETGEDIQAETKDKERVQAQAEAREEPVRAKTLQGGGEVPQAEATAVRSELQARQGRGSSLAADVRGRLEPRFGANFGAVRIHTDAGAVRLTRLLHARAFTRGRDIYFNAGRFNAGSAEGRRLLAHELTHTVQQGVAPPTAPSEPRHGHNQRGEDEETALPSGLTYWTPGGQG